MQDSLSWTSQKAKKDVSSKGRQLGWIIGLCLGTGWSNIACATNLTQTVRFTLATNPQVIALEANFRAARAALTQARGGLFPEVTLEAGQGFEGTANPILKASGVDHRNLLRKESSLTASETLFDGFKVSGEIKQKKAQLQSAIAVLQAQRETIAFQVAEAYFNVLRRREIVDLSKKNVLIHREILAQVKRRYEAGITDKVDVLLAESRLALASSRVVSAAGLLQDAITEFITITGQYPRDLKFPVIPYNAVPSSFHRLRAIAFNTAPTLRAADNNYVAAIENVQIAKAAYYPKFTLDFSETDSNNLDGIVGNNQDIQVMFRAQYKLFRGGSDMALVAENRHRMYSAYEVELNARRELNQKIAFAWDSLKTNQDNLVELKAHVVLSRDVVIGYRKQFTLGRRALFNVLDAENEAFLSRVAYINALYDMRVSIYSVLESAGILVKTLLEYAHPTHTRSFTQRPHDTPKPLPRQPEISAWSKIIAFQRAAQPLPTPQKWLQQLPEPHRTAIASLPTHHTTAVPAFFDVMKILFETVPLPLQLYQSNQNREKHLQTVHQVVHLSVPNTEQLPTPEKTVPSTIEWLPKPRESQRTTELLPKPSQTVVSLTKRTRVALPTLHIEQ